MGDTSTRGKLDLQDFTRLWSQMQAEIRKDIEGAEEANKAWYEKEDHKNSPMAVLFLGVIDAVIHEVAETEVGKQKIEQERFQKEKEKQKKKKKKKKKKKFPWLVPPLKKKKKK